MESWHEVSYAGCLVGWSDVIFWQIAATNIVHREHPASTMIGAMPT
ncbi:MAG: hypothetical protein GX979_11935 [Firmicutes bacterium]|nr:hypothetical protein [Bacillota bacterium]